MTFPGGKNGSGTWQRIINQIPPHRAYVELFLGSGSILRRKRPAERNIGVEIDPAVIATFREAAGGLPNCETLCEDAFDFLARFSFYGDVFLYVDPPYMMGTRRDGRIYRHELTDEDHRRLLRRLKEADGLPDPPMVMISGYWSNMYATELADWRTDSFPSVTRGGTVAAEWLWMNYPAPDRLHDYRFLGDDFRQREKLTRQRRRWIRRLEAMPDLQRRAILAELASID